jgi:hypothetical protein
LNGGLDVYDSARPPTTEKRVTFREERKHHVEEEKREQTSFQLGVDEFTESSATMAQKLDSEGHHIGSFTIPADPDVGLGGLIGTVPNPSKRYGGKKDDEDNLSVKIARDRRRPNHARSHMRAGILKNKSGSIEKDAMAYPPNKSMQ